MDSIRLFHKLLLLSSLEEFTTKMFKFMNKTDYIEYDTGLAFEIEEGYVGLVFPRSSVPKYHLSLANAVSVVDSGYRGSVTARFKKTLDRAWATEYNVGDRIAQIIILPYPQVEFVEADELSSTERGAGGYGSSGV